ncbi:MAG TPA: FAD-dependent monooxygenase [Rhodoblastus sp.]|nr:FAD-dependent monooxygenase [Rhodoblastus sp.]
MSAAVDTDVLIVGAGPVGATAALLCSRLGLRSIVVEKRERRQGPPKAHALNPRSLEIYRALGITRERLAHRALSREDGGLVRFVTALDGLELGAIPYERQDDAAFDATPSPLLNIPQPALEDILLEQIAGRADIDLRRPETWESATNERERVVSTLSGRAGSRRIASRYLLACDGAESAVRKHCGIGMPGDARIEDRIMIHIEGDLRPIVGERAGVLHFIMDPAIAATLIAYDPASTHVLMHRYDSQRETADAFTPQRCEAIVRHALGETADFVIRHISPWTMTALVAERYRAGRVFLCGDAAHRFPPSGGLGLNSGVQDAHNLVWKLTAVEAGWSDAALLDSYEPERKPVAAAYSAQSHGNAARMARLFSFVADAFRACHGDRTAAERRLSSPENRARLAELVEIQKPHFDSFGLQLGFRYGDRDWTDHVSDFTPLLVPGARLPHAWIEIGGRRASTLDLVDPAAFALILNDERKIWRDAFSATAAPVRVVALGTDFSDGSGMWTALVEAFGAQAILVRPDGHIACVARDDGPESLARVKRTLARPVFE